MIDDDLDGPRIGELFLAEVVGREYASLGSLSVSDLSDPVTFSCEIGDTYDIIADDEKIAEVIVEETLIEIDVVGGGRIVVDGGGAIKPVLDELLELVATQ